MIDCKFSTDEVPGKIGKRERLIISHVITTLEELFGGYSTDEQSRIETPIGEVFRTFEIKKREFQVTFTFKGYSCGYKHSQTDQIEMGITITEIVHKEAFETFNQLLPRFGTSSES